MIAVLTGKLIFIEQHHIIVDVQGVGYEIQLGDNALQEIKEQLDEVVTIFVSMIVRENEIALVGFKDAMSKKVFLLLLSVHGVGAKAALSIVDQVSFQSITSAVHNKDHRLFSQVKGIGQKTAEKILLELESKIKKLPIHLLDNPKDTETTKTQKPKTRVQLESALKNLGFQKNAIVETLDNCWSEDLNFEENLKICLSALDKHKNRS